MNLAQLALLVDDHKLFCEAISYNLKQYNIFKDVHYTHNYSDSIAKLKNYNYNIVLLDIEIREPDKNGFDIALWIKKNSPSTKILMLSQYDSRYYVQKYHEMNLDGYFLKNGNISQLKRAIQEILIGEKYIHPEVQMVLSKIIDSKILESKKSLSRREIEIIEQLYTDKPLKEISNILQIEISTLNKHIHSIKIKTNTKKISGIVKFALDNGLIK